MKHLDPPTCVFVFAGYEQQMEEFLKVNEGLARRIPYRYNFTAYTREQLTEIFKVMCVGKGEQVPEEVLEEVPRMLGEVSEEQLASQNAGAVSNWISFAQMERDDRVDIREARRDPQILCRLAMEDLEAGIIKVSAMAQAGQ
jgi:hypothetical protein